MNIEELARLFAENVPPVRLPDLDQTASVEVEPERYVDESGEDIVVRLRQGTPCIVCRAVCEDAAIEIERLRLQDERISVADGDILLRLNSAIFSMDPCGRKDCISPSAAFLASLREEICRLRAIEAKAASLAAAAKRVWRGESPVSSLIHSVISFEKEKSRQ